MSSLPYHREDGNGTDGPSWQRELEDCRLCGWSCGVNRLEGEKGVCQLDLPAVAHATLHPAPPASYTIFMAGCNFRCLFCQNWIISTYPGRQDCSPEHLAPEETAETALSELDSSYARMIRADRIFFSGGSPTPSFPFVEAVVHAARQQNPWTKVNYDTNGFMAGSVFGRMIDLADSVTFDVRAVSDDVHRTLTGAPVAPVLENVRRMAAHPEKLWEFRILVVPGLNTGEIPEICRFIADLDPELPVCFLAFQPNFYLDGLRGATLQEMQQAEQTARKCGLKNVSWSGRPGLSGEPPPEEGPSGIELPCPLTPRLCGSCEDPASCPLDRHQPRRNT